MPARGKASLDSSDYDRKVEALRKNTRSAANDMSKSFSNVGSSIRNAGKAVNMLASEVSGKLGAVGNTIGALASGPIAGLLAGFAALLAAGREMWDNLTLSAEEYAAKLDATAKIQDRKLAVMEKEQSAEQGYMERLKELAEKENLSNAEKDESVFLINTLTTKYGELGIEVDGVTNKIKNLAQAEETLNVKQRQARMSALEERIKTEMKRGERYYANNLDSGIFGTLDEWLGNNRMKVQDYRSMDVEGRMAFANKQLDREGITKKELDFWSQEIDRLQKIQDMTDELNNLRDYGQKSVEAQAAALENASKTEEAAIKKATDEENKLFEAAQKATEEFQEQLRAARELEKTERNRKEQYLVGQVMPLRDAALRASGMGRQADIDSAVWSATQSKGSALTDEEYARVVDMAGAKYDLNDALRNRFSGIDFAPRVNSLIARGGSEAPIAMPKVEEIQTKTYSSVEKIQTACEKILSSIDDWLTT